MCEAALAGKSITVFRLFATETNPYGKDQQPFRAGSREPCSIKEVKLPPREVI
jgi:hypothetical protein